MNKPYFPLQQTQFRYSREDWHIIL